jgi:hypothetical protein
VHDVNYIVHGLFVMQKEIQECNDGSEVNNATSNSCIALHLFILFIFIRAG